MKQPTQVTNIWFDKHYHDGLTIKAVSKKSNKCILFFVYPHENDRRNDPASYEFGSMDYSLDDHPDNKKMKWDQLAKGIQQVIIKHINEIERNMMKFLKHEIVVKTDISQGNTQGMKQIEVFNEQGESVYCSHWFDESDLNLEQNEARFWIIDNASA